jgi:hypothetical protein
MAEETGGAAGLDRRTLLRLMVSEAASFVSEVRGHRQLKLDEIESLPAAVVDMMRPLLRNETSMAIGREEIRILLRGRDIAALPFDPVAEAVLRAFDGRYPIARIAGDVASRFSRDPRATLDYARRLFAFLAGRGACAPAEALPEEEDDEG